MLLNSISIWGLFFFLICAVFVTFWFEKARWCKFWGACQSLPVTPPLNLTVFGSVLLLYDLDPGLGSNFLTASPKHEQTTDQCICGLFVSLLRVLLLLITHLNNTVMFLEDPKDLWGLDHSSLFKHPPQLLWIKIFIAGLKQANFLLST